MSENNVEIDLVALQIMMLFRITATYVCHEAQATYVCHEAQFD